MDKNIFRQEQLQKLNDQQSQTAIESGLLLEQLLGTQLWQKADTIGITISNPIEVNTAPIIKAALLMGKKIYLPKVMPNYELAFIPYTGKEKLIKSDYGIFEPEYNALLAKKQLDLMIVPGVAFALDSGYRVGFGGGYYDRFLADFSGQTVALVPSVMRFETAQWNIEAFDIQIQNLITVAK